jgi:uncharacterized protein (TIGR03000 family)
MNESSAKGGTSVHRILLLPVLVLLGLGLLAPAAPALSQESTTKSEPAKLQVILPADAKLSVDGTATKQKGEVRKFISPPLPAGKKFVYTLKATWMEEGKEVTREKVTRIEAGQEVVVNLKEEDGKKDDKKEDQDRRPDVIYVPTPQEVVDKMLELAKVAKDDVVYDLGCGDGRIPVTAAKKYGCKAWGFDIDPERIKESLENVEKNKVGKLVTIEKKDIFTLDLSKANVVTLYLLPDLNVKLMPQLAKLKPGSRIVSHDFDMRGAKPKEKITVRADDRDHTVYLWIVPWEKEE